MFTVVTGGSGSGKSEFSENYLLKLDEQTGGNRERFYIATMFPYDEESHRRIARHRAMRRDKGFQTLECYTGLKDLEIPERNGRKPAVLLECMSNLAANEYYREEGAGPDCAGEIIEGIRRLRAQSAHLVVVTNEVFSDGIFLRQERGGLYPCSGADQQTDGRALRYIRGGGLYHSCLS